MRYLIFLKKVAKFSASANITLPKAGAKSVDCGHAVPNEANVDAIIECEFNFNLFPVT